VYKRYWGEGGNHIAFHAYIWTFTSSIPTVTRLTLHLFLIARCRTGFDGDDTNIQFQVTIFLVDCPSKFRRSCHYDRSRTTRA